MKQILAYANQLSATDEIINWLNTTAKKAIQKQNTTLESLEHIVDFLVSNQAPNRLQKMSIEQATRKAKEWSESNQKKGKDLIDSDEDIEVIHRFSDQSTIVKLKTKNAYKREGFLMSHCLGGYDIKEGVEIYSYRDKQNMPHATFELRKNQGEVIQIKGKGNGDIHPKYIEPILTFLEKVGQTIRPSEMKHLGYYHVTKEQLEILKYYETKNEKIVDVRGECYVV